MKKEILDKKNIIHQIMNKCIVRYSIDEVEEISDLLMEAICNAFIEGKSIKYSEDTPLFKAKVSMPNDNEGNSPKVARNAHIIVSAKFKLKEK